nr:OPT/YSL family transporter [Thermoanaerobaculia bacterium]
LHLGDIKGAVADRLGELERRGVTSVEYTGAHAALAARTYALDEVRALAPEVQNELLQTNAGFGGAKIPAPQASLMAVVARSIMERQTEWILILVGVFMGLAFILMQVKSPMLVSVGMYLPIETSFAIFVGGLFKGLLDRVAEREAWDGERKSLVGNTGTLLASGLIAGEAIIGILFAALAFRDIALPAIFARPAYLASVVSMAILGAILIAIPRRRGRAAS